MEEYIPDDSWKSDVEQKIDALRKSTVRINFADNVDATKLGVDVAQETHNFPFGQAVVSEKISDCYLAGSDNGDRKIQVYCHTIQFL